MMKVRDVTSGLSIACLIKIQATDVTFFLRHPVCSLSKAVLPPNDADLIFGAVRLVFCNLCYDSWTYGIIYCGDTGVCLELHARLLCLWLAAK